MSKKISKKLSCHIVCPDCGSRLSTLDHGYSICYECGWSWSPALHQHAVPARPLPKLNAAF